MVEARKTTSSDAVDFTLPERRPLEEIYRPYTDIVHLSNFGNRIAVDDQMVLSFQVLRVLNKYKLDPNTPPTENLIVAKRRSLFVVFPKSPYDVYDPPELKNPDEIGATFISLRPRGKHFYAGERYEMSFLPTEERQQRDPIDVLVSSVRPIALTVVPDNIRDHDFLRQAQSR